MKRFLIMLSCMVYAIIMMALPAQAASVTSDMSSLTLYYYADEQGLPIAGAKFNLYMVALADGQGGYTVTSDFEDYKVDLKDLHWDEAGRLTALAGTLSGYVARDGITPIRTGTIDTRGYLTFDGLEAGLYLVCGDSATISMGNESWIFTPEPFLIPLPFATMNNHGEHDVEVDVKYEYINLPTSNDRLNLTVKKVWEGGDEHPLSIVAQLLRNGFVFDEVELNANNGWQYIWTDLEAGPIWQIVEKDVPDGYTVIVTQEGYAFTITNFSENPTDSPDESTDGEQDPPEEPIEVLPDDPELPQTGQLWWPVPVMLSVGILLLGAGVVLRKG